MFQRTAAGRILMKLHVRRIKCRQVTCKRSAIKTAIPQVSLWISHPMENVSTDKLTVIFQVMALTCS